MKTLHFLSGNMLISQITAERMVPDASSTGTIESNINHPKDSDLAHSSSSSPPEYLVPSDSNILTRLQNHDSAYSRPVYDWSATAYTNRLRSVTDPANWPFEHHNNSPWLTDLASTSVSSYHNLYNSHTDNSNYSHLAAGITPNSVAATNLLSPNRIPPISDHYQTPITPTRGPQSPGTSYTPTSLSSSRSRASATGPTPGRSRKYVGKASCKCPNCEFIESDQGPRAAIVKAKGEHNCHIRGCGKIYHKTSHLKAHLRWHTADRSMHVCNWLFCGKRFERSEELQRHLRTHTGDSKFACQSCGKNFTRNDHLTKHLKVHDEEASQPASQALRTPKCEAIVNNNNIETSNSLKQESLVILQPQ